MIPWQIQQLRHQVVQYRSCNSVLWWTGYPCRLHLVISPASLPQAECSSPSSPTTKRTQLILPNVCKLKPQDCLQHPMSCPITSTCLTPSCHRMLSSCLNISNICYYHSSSPSLTLDYILDDGTLRY